MITAQMARDLVETYPSRVFQEQLNSVLADIKMSASMGERSISSDLSRFKYKERIVIELTKAGFNVKESTFSFNKKEQILDVISW